LDIFSRNISDRICVHMVHTIFPPDMLLSLIFPVITTVIRYGYLQLKYSVMLRFLLELPKTQSTGLVNSINIFIHPKTHDSFRKRIKIIQLRRHPGRWPAINYLYIIIISIFDYDGM
jgi:fatty-acid desaturase